MKFEGFFDKFFIKEDDISAKENPILAEEILKSEGKDEKYLNELKGLNEKILCTEFQNATKKSKEKLTDTSNSNEVSS